MAVRLSLTARIAVAGSVAAAILVVVVGGASLLTLRHQSIIAIKSDARHVAEIQARRMTMLLDGVVSHLDSTARNPLIANSLTDSEGRDAYVKPFMNGLKEVNGVPVRATITDFRGRPLVRPDAGLKSVAVGDVARQAIESGEQVGGLIDLNEDGNPRLLYATPIIYANTGQAEGALVYDLEPADLVAALGKDDLLTTIHLVLDASPREGQGDWATEIYSAPIPGNLWVTAIAVADPGRLHNLLTNLVWTIIGVGILTLMVVGIGSRLVARAMTRQLRQLEADAAGVVATGSFSQRFKAGGADEVARLAQSFNSVLDRLEAAQRDINHQAELRLQDSEARYRLLAEYASDVLARIGRDGLIRYVSPAALRTYGYQPAHMAGRRVVDYVHPEDRPLVEGALETASETEVRDLVFRLRRAEGDWSWVEASAHPVPACEGSETDLVTIIRDIDQRRQVEAALEAKTHDLERSNGELEQFAYVASHDLREPLRMVSSYMQLIARKLGDSDPEMSEFLGFAIDGAKRMDRLILDMLEFSRVGRNRPPAEPVPLADVLTVAAEPFRPSLTRGAAIDLPDTDAMILGDRQELGRLFQNIIGNGLKYRRADVAPRIALTVTVEDRRAVVSVADNGIGIAPEHFQRIFNIFQRLHGRDEFDGTGIGLAVCKKIVDRHGGAIWLDSTVGQGSVFHIALPLAAPAAQADQSLRLPTTASAV